MPVRTPSLAIAAVLLAGACAGGPSEPPLVADRTAVADPPAGVERTADAAPSLDPAEEVSLAIPVGATPDGTRLEVVVRSIEVGGRREVVLETPAGVVDHHVIDGDRHWWWIPPSARALTEGVEWVHLDVAEAEEVGELPDLVADARVPLPRPGAVAEGSVVAGHEVVAVRHVGDDEDHLVVAGLDDPAVLRRRPLPAGTRIELPTRATHLRDLDDALDR